MNDPVIERIAREDPAAAGGAGAGPEAMLARLQASIETPGPGTGAGRVRGRRSHRLAPAALGAVLVAVIVAAVAFVVLAGRHTRSAAVDSSRVTGSVRLVPAAGVRVGVGPADLLVADGSLWVVGEGYVARLNPSDGHEQARIRMPAGVIGNAQLAAGAGSIWVAYEGQDRIRRIDPRDDRVVATIGLGGAPSGGGIAVAHGRVWASIDSPGRHGHVLVIDPGTDRISGPPAAVGTGPGRMHAGLGFVWVQNTSAPHATASRIDPATRAVRQLAMKGEPMAGFGHIWTLGAPYGGRPAGLSRYSLGTSRAYTPGAPFPRGTALAFGAGRVWVLSHPRSRASAPAHPVRGTATVTPVVPASRPYELSVGRPTRLDAVQPLAIAVAGRDLWVADYAGGDLLHFRIRR